MSGRTASITVRGRAGALTGDCAVPGDKSIGHRAVMFAALGDGPAHVEGLSGGEDNRSTVRAFRQLGVQISDAGSGALDIHGRGLRGLVASSGPIDCGNSGTTIRLISGVLAPQRFASTLVGDQYLEVRPMGRVAKPLRAMGARIEGRSGESIGKKAGDVYPPLVVGPAAGPLDGIDWDSPIASAQVKSAVLLAALSAGGRTRFREPTRSRDHTERMLRAMGAPISVEDGWIVVHPAGWNGRLEPQNFVVPGDLSSAAFLLGAALLVPGSRVTVRGVGINPTRTGVLDAMRAMGARITVDAEREVGGEPVADLTAEGTSNGLVGTTIAGDLSVRAIDELPLLAALASHAAGETVIADASELRVKESDRIAATASALRALGASVEERPDGMVIAGRPGQLTAGQVQSHGDHRIAMASAVCALAITGETLIEDTANVATSFPGFTPTLARLGAPIQTG